MALNTLLRCYLQVLEVGVELIMDCGARLHDIYPASHRYRADRDQAPSARFTHCTILESRIIDQRRGEDANIDLICNSVIQVKSVLFTLENRQPTADAIYRLEPLAELYSVGLLEIIANSDSNKHVPWVKYEISDGMRHQLSLEFATTN